VNGLITTNNSSRLHVEFISTLLDRPKQIEIGIGALLRRHIVEKTHAASRAHSMRFLLSV
jgi:hypothetical protein